MAHFERLSEVVNTVLSSVGKIGSLMLFGIISWLCQVFSISRITVFKTNIKMRRVYVQISHLNEFCTGLLGACGGGPSVLCYCSRKRLVLPLKGRSIAVVSMKFRHQFGLGFFCKSCRKIFSTVSIATNGRNEFDIMWLSVITVLDTSVFTIHLKTQPRQKKFSATSITCNLSYQAMQTCCLVLQANVPQTAWRIL